MSLHKKLISVHKSHFNRKTFKRLRKQKVKVTGEVGMTKKEVAIYAGVGEAQVLRYETMKELNMQSPKLKTFKRLCILFQVDPKDLLNLAWVKGELADKIDGRQCEFCPTCGTVLPSGEKHESDNCD